MGAGEFLLDEQDGVEGEWWIKPDAGADDSFAAANRTALRCARATKEAFDPWIVQWWPPRVTISWRNGGPSRDGGTLDLSLTDDLGSQLTEPAIDRLITDVFIDGRVATGGTPGALEAVYTCWFSSSPAPPIAENQVISLTTQLHAWIDRSTDRRSNKAMEEALRRWEELIGAPIYDWGINHDRFLADRHGFEILP